MTILLTVLDEDTVTADCCGTPRPADTPPCPWCNLIVCPECAEGYCCEDAAADARDSELGDPGYWD